MSGKIINYRITAHAALEILRRGLDIEVIDRVLSAPEQMHEVRPGRIVLQSIVSLGAPPGDYLIRVFVDTDRDPCEVITAYRTSKISKYWRDDR